MHSNHEYRWYNGNTQHRRRGFTLIEVLISVVILAIALGASLDGLANYSAAQSYLQERYMAHLVAWNTLVNIYNSQNDGDQCDNAGSSEGFEEQAGVRWNWVQNVEVISDIGDSAAIGEEDLDTSPLFSVKVYAPNADPNEARPISVLSIIAC